MQVFYRYYIKFNLNALIISLFYNKYQNVPFNKINHEKKCIYILIPKVDIFNKHFLYVSK